MLTKNIFIIISAVSLALGLLLSLSDTFIINFISFLGGLLHQNLDILFWKIGFEKLGVELIIVSINYCLVALFYKKNPKLTILICCLLWVLLFIFYVLRDSVNIPIADDYDFFLGFLINYSSTHDVRQVFAQESESRMAIMHLLSIVLFHLDAFNFKTLIFFSTLCLVGNVLLLYKSITKEMKQRTFLFLILVILLFQFQYYDSVLFASGSLYSTCTIFYSLCSIYFLNKESKLSMIPAIAFALLAILNCGSGFTLLISGLILLITQNRRKHLLLWILFATGISMAYFYNYLFKKENIFSYFDFAMIGYKTVKCIQFSFAFLGSPFQFLYQIILPTILGGIIWLYFIILTLKKYYRKNPVIYFTLIFLILTSLLPPLLRSNYKIEDALGIRYGVYAVMALCCCIVAFFENYNSEKNKTFLQYFFAFSLIYHLLTNIFFYPEVVIRKENLLIFVQNIKNGTPYILPVHAPENAAQILKEASKKRIYKFPNDEKENIQYAAPGDSSAIYHILFYSQLLQPASL